MSKDEWVRFTAKTLDAVRLMICLCPTPALCRYRCQRHERNIRLVCWPYERNIRLVAGGIILFALIVISLAISHRVCWI